MLAKFVTAAALAAATTAAAQPAPATSHALEVHVIVNVDLIPSDAAAGTRLLADHASRARRADGVVAFSLLRQDGSTNHFIIDARFASAAAYERFVASPDVRTFRTALYPHLGSPWDARTGHDVAP